MSDTSPWKAVASVSRGAPGIKVTVRLPAEVTAHLRRLARDRGATVSSVIRSALEEQDKTELLAARMEKVLQLLEGSNRQPPIAEDVDSSGRPFESEASEVVDTEALAKNMRSILAGFDLDNQA